MTSLLEDGNTTTADEAYVRAVELACLGEVAETAKAGRGRIAEATFRERGAGDVRMGADMYCVGALDRFAKTLVAERGEVLMEIATPGEQGLDGNDATQKYRLRTLPGQFSGLHLMCRLYFGIPQMGLGADVGPDLAREHHVSLPMHAAVPGEQSALALDQRLARSTGCTTWRPSSTSGLPKPSATRRPGMSGRRGHGRCRRCSTEGP